MRTTVDELLSKGHKRGLIHLCVYTHSLRPLTPTPAFRDDQDSGTTPWCGYNRGEAGRQAWDLNLQDSGASYG